MKDQQLGILIFLEKLDQQCSLLSELQSLGVDPLGNCRVSFRSIHVPIDRLQPQLAAPGNDQVYLVVICGSTPLTDILRKEFPCPVLEIEPDETISTAALTIAKFVSLFSPSVHARVHRRVESIRQAALVNDSKLKVQSYESQIARCFDEKQQILGDSIQLEGYQRFRGKVRDRWESEECCVLITTDRQSGFDRQLAVVPFKGAVLNLCSQFWFEQTSDIIPNHLISIPHPSVAIVRRCQPFPIEFVVR